MPVVTPCLWFESQAEEAAEFYVSLFPNSRVVGRTPGPGGGTLVVQFELEGRPFMALNGGPHEAFNDAVSFSVDCETQADIDRYWDALCAGGREVQCGWLKDRYGVSWQIVPKALSGLIAGPDPEGSRRAVEAMMKMVKLDVAALEAAYRG